MQKRDWLEVSEWAALAVSLATDAVNVLGLASDEVEEHFIEPLAKASNPQLLLEVQSIIAERPEIINLERISAIRDLRQKQALGARQNMASSLSCGGDNVEDMSWSCVVNDMKHDIQAMKIYQQQKSSFERAIYFGELEARREKELESIAAVNALLESCCRVMAYDPPTAQSKYLAHVVPICAKPHIKISESNLVPCGERLCWVVLWSCADKGATIQFMFGLGS